MPDIQDEIGTAGTALGAIGLTFQLLEGCKAGFSLWKDTTGLGEDAANFIIRLRFEAKAQLERWELGWEFDRGADSPFFSNRRYHQDREAALNYINLVYDRLYCLNSLEDDYPALKAAKNLPVTPAASALRIANFQQPSSTERGALAKHMNNIQSSSTIRQRLSWAMDNGTRAQERLDEVVRMINTLFHVFPPPKDDPYAQVALSQVQTAHANLTGQAARDPLAIALAHLQGAVAAIEARTSSLAGIKPYAFKSRELDDACKVPDRRNKRAVGKARTAGAYVDVLVEWKTVDSKSADKRGYGVAYKNVMESRISNIARLMLSAPTKPPELRTLDCLGIANREGQTSTERVYGLVYRLPSSGYLTLLQLLERNLDKSLDDRIKIAVLVSKALLFFHLAGWSHKGIRSDNILFFQDAKGQYELNKPYLTGFEYSRESGENQLTEGVNDDLEWNLYRHPDVQGIPEEPTSSQSGTTQQASRPSFTTIHDIYSFGVVLVELGLRKSVKSMYDAAHASKGYNHSPGAFRDRLLAYEIPNLAAVAPKGYCDVAGRCLMGEFTMEKDETLEQAFYRQGVHLLLRGLDLGGA
jgi:serine/threonine protein kinase